MQETRLFGLILLGALCTACSDPEPQQPEEAAPERLFDGQRKALEQAREVEGLLQEAQQQRREQEDAAEQGQP